MSLGLQVAVPVKTRFSTTSALTNGGKANSRLENKIWANLHVFVIVVNPFKCVEFEPLPRLSDRLSTHIMKREIAGAECAKKVSSFLHTREHPLLTSQHFLDFDITYE